MMRLLIVCALCSTSVAIHLNPVKPKLADQAQEQLLDAELQTQMLPTEKRLWEAAVEEAGLDKSKISKFGKAVIKYPKAVVEKLLEIQKNTPRKHKYNFFGRISGTFKTGTEEKARQWAIDFAKANFSNEDLFVSTRFDGKWKTLGAFDKSEELGLGKRDGHKFAKIDAKNKIDLTYWDVMLSSDFTLCPGGDDHWSFRGYEAAIAGSICIIKDTTADWSPMLTTGFPKPVNLVNPRMRPLDEVFKLLKFKKKDDELVYDEEIAKHNREVFIKYLTFMEGDNVPPEFEKPLQKPAKKSKFVSTDESEQKMTVTVTKSGKGKPVCDNCHGDPSDMIQAFYRYSAKLQKKRVFGENIKDFQVAADTYFWNAKETAQCFKNKYVLMLGDSTLLENLNDIIMLLNGGPSKKSVFQMYQDFAKIPTHSISRSKTVNGLMVRENRMNRNQTITLPEQNTTINFRFIGAVNLTDNCGGLKSILESPLKEQIDEMVRNGGRQPDAIVLQSGPHDMCNALYAKNHYKNYYDALEKVGPQIVAPWQQSGIKVIWRGNWRFQDEEQDLANPKIKNEMRYPKKMDDEAKKMIEQNGGEFVDIADMLANYHDETGCCKTIDSATSVSPHFGSVAIRQFDKSSAFFSQLATYRILDKICEA